MKLERKSGILLHITSLPSPFGIGDLGDGAFRFADSLQTAEQRLWQVLPLHPTEIQFGNSPYSCTSAFALNPLLISLQVLMRKGFLRKDDLEEHPRFSGNRVDYGPVTEWKEKILFRAFQNFRNKRNGYGEFEPFCDTNRHWLEEYALFTALRRRMDGLTWQSWPVPLRDRHAGGLREARGELKESIECEKFWQYLCFEQWLDLKSYCSERSITIIGDIPLYVNYESADVWSHSRLFKLDDEKRPVCVSGVPPDFFSDTGQLWNNPIFDWGRLKEEGYSWWIERIAHNLRLFDCIRIDHFRGLAGYWEVPTGAETAEAGKWVTGPGEDFLNETARRFPSLPFIAEDLGVITEDVIALRDGFDLPGMRVFQFGFGKSPDEHHLPHHYVENCVAYPGTHDNETLSGWLSGSSGGHRRPMREMMRRRRQVRRYTGCRACGREKILSAVLENLMRSRAAWVIIPIQDIMGLGNEERMNTPGTVQGNWEWRMAKGELNNSIWENLCSMTAGCGRAKNSNVIRS